MSKFAAFYMFSEAFSTIALQRLRRLRVLNPDVTFIPVVGVTQFLYVPMIVDQFMFGSVRTLRLVGAVSHTINYMASSASGVFRLSEVINKKVGVFIRGSNLTELATRLRHEGLQSYGLDFTPMALWNLDHAIMRWFNSSGKLLDFDYFIFYEPDSYTTKPLDEIYGMYTKSFDACFVDYGRATKGWHFYDFPPGSNRATRNWLKQRKLPTTLYRSIFGGNLISRRILERLEKLGIDFSGAPYCQAEMRLPTVLTAIGYKCGKLDFPFFRYRPVWTENEILANERVGIFHPVKNLISTETKN